MTLGYAKILTCPHCGGKKEVLSLNSGNTFGQVVWSDSKSVAPMMPRVSFIQECPHCGKFFLMSRQTNGVRGEYPSFEKGILSYAKLKEAWKQISAMPDLTEDEKIMALFMQVWTFNDEYTRETKKEIPAEEHDYIVSVVDQIVAIDSVDNLLKAELLRETGRFEKAIELLDAYEAANDYREKLRKRYKEAAEARNTLPFVVYGIKGED